MTIIRKAHLRSLLALGVLLLWGLPAGAHDLRQGTSAYRQGHYGEAAAILKPLAEDGNPFAQFAIGVMHDDGRGLPQDLSRALSWYTRAAHAGLVDAQYMVGRFYGSGRGVKQNPARAFFWFNLAAAGGDPRAALLRDQHAHQITPAERRRREAEAVSWQSRHAHHFTCRFQRCIYPRWTAPPRWTPLDPDRLGPD
jgi:TPR repeat protein